MRLLRLLLFPCCLLAVGCADAAWELAHNSPLPAGLRSDAQAQRAAATSSNIRLDIYAGGTDRLLFRREYDTILTRVADAGSYHSPVGGVDPADTVFFISFNGVESQVRLVARPNIIAFYDEPGGTER